MKKLNQMYHEIGLVMILLIYLFTYITRQDQFWAGRATFFALFVLLSVALLDVLNKKETKKK